MPIENDRLAPILKEGRRLGEIKLPNWFETRDLLAEGAYNWEGPANPILQSSKYSEFRPDALDMNSRFAITIDEIDHYVVPEIVKATQLTQLLRSIGGKVRVPTKSELEFGAELRYQHIKNKPNWSDYHHFSAKLDN